MITEPDAATVLCYGDSNTYGQRSDGVHGRWPADVRWTGVLQRMLGDGFGVVEEGLGGRTTDVDDAGLPGRDGRAYLVPCLHSHHPVDVVVVMLGTNDLKARFGRSAEQVVAAVGRLLDDVAGNAVGRDGSPGSVVLLSPVVLAERAAQAAGSDFDAGSVARSRELAEPLRTLAEARGVLFADVATVARVGDDGVHLGRESHRRVAALVAGRVVQALGLRWGG